MRSKKKRNGVILQAKALIYCIFILFSFWLELQFGLLLLICGIQLNYLVACQLTLNDRYKPLSEVFFKIHALFSASVQSKTFHTIFLLSFEMHFIKLCASPKRKSFSYSQDTHFCRLMWTAHVWIKITRIIQAQSFNRKIESQWNLYIEHSAEIKRIKKRKIEVGSDIR